MRRWTSPLAWGLALVLAACAWLQAPGESSLPGVGIDQAQMRQSGADWVALDTRVLAGWSGPYELRWRLLLDQDTPSLGLRVAVRGASELRCCNGQLVLRNGQPSDSAADEQPGQVDRWVVLPPLDAGAHELHIRASSHHLQPGRFNSAEATLVPMSQESMPRQRFARWLVVAVATGALGLAWLYFLCVGQPAPAAGPSRRGPLWSLIALGAAGLLLPALESVRDLWGYAYPLHPWRLNAVLLLTLATAWLLPLALAQRWGSPSRLAPWAAGWAAVLVLLAWGFERQFGYDVACWVLHQAALAAALLLAGRAHTEAGEPVPALLTLLLIALVLSWWIPGAFLDGLYTLTLTLVMTLLLLSHAQRQQRQALAEAGLRQALQAQLLHASMQPHGLMNTLAVLQELIEQRPALASRLVERLADQFSLLRALSHKGVVPLREELALVRTQLDLVELARDLPLPLAVYGPVDPVYVPAGVLHTLVENAITHGGVRAGAAGFALHIDAAADQSWQLCLHSPRGAGRVGGSGQGLRFVRESLAGAFGERFSCSSGPLDEAVWLDRLNVPRR
jgi:hypothetical protein